MSLFSLFRRRPRAPRSVRDIRDACGVWRAGDLAVCIDDNWGVDRAATDPRMGDVLRVRGLRDAVNHHGVRAIFLWFEGKPAATGYAAACFRKAALDRSAADTRFAARIRRVAKAPARTGEPA